MSAQFKIALARAGASAAFNGASVFLATWAVTNDLKVIVIAAATTIIGTLGTRFAAEGWIDTKAANKTDA